MTLWGTMPQESMIKLYNIKSISQHYNFYQQMFSKCSLGYTDRFLCRYTFKSLVALCKWKGSNTYSLISFKWDLIIHSTKSIIILKAPVEPICTRYAIHMIWWFVSTKRKNNIQGFEMLWYHIYFLTHWVTLVSVLSIVKVFTSRSKKP